MTTFYTILTDRGKSKLSACIAAGTRLPLSSIKVGEGLNGAYYDPVASQTALQSPVLTGDILSMMVSPDNPEWLMVEAIIICGDLQVDKWGIISGYLLSTKFTHPGQHDVNCGITPPLVTRFRNSVVSSRIVKSAP